MEKGMQNFDPLDMNNYRIEKLPKLNKSGFEKWMAYMGGPLAVLVFAFLYWFSDISFLQNIDPATLTQNALKRFNEIGANEFSSDKYFLLDEHNRVVLVGNPVSSPQMEKSYWDEIIDKPVK